MEPLPVNINFDENYGIKKLQVTVGSGNLKNHLTFLKSLTTDSKILEIIQGYKIDFSMMPYQHNPRITPIPKKYDQINFNSG